MRLLIICDDESLLKDKFQEWDLISTEGSFHCLKCNTTLKLRKKADKPGGQRWVCRETLNMPQK